MKNHPPSQNRIYHYIILKWGEGGIYICQALTKYKSQHHPSIEKLTPYKFYSRAPYFDEIHNKFKTSIRPSRFRSNFLVRVLALMRLLMRKLPLHLSDPGETGVVVLLQLQASGTGCHGKLLVDAVPVHIKTN